MDSVYKRNVIVVGSGPAGFTAAIYCARAGMAPVVFEGTAAAGGALMTTSDVENFPGFPEGIEGPDLMGKMRDQARRFGAELVAEDVRSVILSGKQKTVATDRSEYSAPAIILATGSAHRRLGVPGEDRLAGRGVSWCATCDGYFFRGQHVVVVGGGDTAMEEAIFLTRFASKVTLVHRSATLRASKILQDRAMSNNNIEFIMNSSVRKLLGADRLLGVELADLHSGNAITLDADGLFVAIGHTPRSELFRGQLDLDEHGYVIVDHQSSTTRLPGVFACGDLVDSKYRQAITAAGSGCMAAIDAERFTTGAFPASLADA